MKNSLLSLVVLFLSANYSWATTFNVSNFTELAAAFSNANDDDVIEFDIGSTITMAGDLTIDDNLTINGNGSTLEYNNTAFKIIINNSKGLVINDLTLQNGNGILNNSNGGCILGDDFVALTLNNCKLLNNSANTGGAILLGTNAELNINSSTFSNNRSFIDSRAGNGGAIFMDFDSELNINSSTFTNNRAFDNGADGGVMYIQDRSNIYIEDSNFQNNQSDDEGGAIFHNGDGDLTITNSVFENSIGENGGVIYLNSGDLSSLEITCCTFRNNVVVNQGGVLLNNGSRAGGLISNCIFEDNAAISNDGDIPCRGGAIYHNGGPLEIRNSIFNRNRALPFSNPFNEDYGGGAIHHNRDDLTINNCSFSGNETNDNGTGATIRVSVFNVFNSRIVDLLDIRNTEITNSIGGEDIYFFGDPATPGFVLNSDNASITSCATSDGACPSFSVTNANNLGAADIDDLCSEETEELPTIGQWGLILFGLSLLLFGVFLLRRLEGRKL